MSSLSEFSFVFLYVLPVYSHYYFAVCISSPISYFTFLIPPTKLLEVIGKFSSFARRSQVLQMSTELAQM
jgi:hypothetical protein